MDAPSVFNGIPTEIRDELFTTLHEVQGVRIERIVSEGHRSPEGFWYDQAEHEWVIVLQGKAAVQFEGDAEPVELGPGSYLNIAAHKWHRVSWTSAAEKTVWLAVHYSG